MIFRNELETGGGDPSRIHMRRCKRCKCTNYAKAVKHNAAGEVIRCSVCSQDPMTLAQHAQDSFEEAREQMYVQSCCGKLANPVDTEHRIKAAIHAAKVGLHWIGIFNAATQPTAEPPE